MLQYISILCYLFFKSSFFEYSFYQCSLLSYHLSFFEMATSSKEIPSRKLKHDIDNAQTKSSITLVFPPWDGRSIKKLSRIKNKMFPGCSLTILRC